MASPLFLLDSVCLIDHLNAVAPATQFLEANHARSALSFITRAEVLAGFKAGAPAPVRQLLDAFTFLGADREVSDVAGRLRAKEGWKLPDAFQAALAIRDGLRLVTRNTRDFPPEKYPFVYVAYRV